MMRDFFAGLCNGWMRPRSGNRTAAPFASGINTPVDLQVGPDGSLYYLSRGDGIVSRIRYAGGLGGRVVVSPVALTFSTRLGRRSRKQVTIRNGGSGPLTVRVGELESPFAVASGGGTFTLRKGRSRRVVVEFVPTASAYGLGS